MVYIQQVEYSILVAHKSVASKGVDVDATGAINGVPIYDFDLNTLQPDEKAWRKPGADITDYFNYGFTEDSWMKYCEKQRRMRIETGAPPIQKTYNVSSNKLIQNQTIHFQRAYCCIFNSKPII